MRSAHSTFIAVAAGLLLAVAARAQDTNVLKTEIELFEAQPDTVIVRGFDLVGAIDTPAGNLSVRNKESTEIGSGRKLFGLAIELQANGERVRAVVDYDELEAFVDGVNYLNRITPDASGQMSFEAHILTKSGLRLIAFSARRQGSIQFFLQFDELAPRISLSADQMNRLATLLGQARKSLDALRNGN